MSSKFSRHGTTGYRWPKVCVSRPPEPPPTPVAHWTLDLVFTGSISPTAPPQTITLTSDLPVTQTIFSVPNPAYPNQPSQVNLTLPIGGALRLITGIYRADNLVADVAPFTMPPIRTVLTPYDSGVLIWGTLLEPNLGTVRVRIH